MKRLLSLIITSSLLTGCGSLRQVKTVTIETMKDHQVHDTIYVHNLQYDSIYVASDHYIDRGRDTILIKDKQIEYRYRLLRDTVFIRQIEVQHDSIPYEVRIVETKEVEKHPKLLLFAIIIIGFAFIWVCVSIYKFTR